MKAFYTKPKTKEEHELVIAQIFWYTIMPMSITYMSIKFHWIFLILIIPSIIIRIK